MTDHPVYLCFDRDRQLLGYLKESPEPGVTYLFEGIYYICVKAGPVSVFAKEARE